MINEQKLVLHDAGQVRRDLKGTLLHADNGNPMKGATLGVWLATLGVFLSHSRPLVKNDHPYIESCVETVKYHASWPGRFTTIQAARERLGNSIHSYNTVHRHSGIGYVTAEERRTSQISALFELRNQTLLEAWERHPERFPRKGPRLWREQRDVYLNLSAEPRGFVINRAALKKGQRA